MFMRVYSISIKSSFFLSFYTFDQNVFWILSTVCMSFHFGLWFGKLRTCSLTWPKWQNTRVLKSLLIGDCSSILHLTTFLFSLRVHDPFVSIIFLFIFQLSHIAFFFLSIRSYTRMLTYTDFGPLIVYPTNVCVSAYLVGRENEKKKIYIYYSWFQKKTLK